MKTAIVTGATGLIGSALVARLRMQGVNVQTPHYSNELAFCEKSDYVIHAAGYGQPAKFMAEPIRTILVNVPGIIQLSERMKPDGKCLFLSSSEVYSGSKHIPHTESDIGTTAPDHPRGCYIEAKRCGEAAVHAIRAGSLDAKIARVSLVYGPAKWDDKRVMFDFIRQAMTTGVIRLRDRGEAIRTYCYVEDAVTMLLNILMKGTQAVYNVGGESRTSIATLAHVISVMCNAKLVITTEESPMRGAPDEVAVDISRYAAEFGIPEFTPMGDALWRTIEAMRKQMPKQGTAA